MHQGSDLSQLLFNRDDAGEVFQIPIVNFAGCFVRCSGLGANQCLWAAAALGDVGAIAAVAVDYAVQVLPPGLGHWKSGLWLFWISQEFCQSLAVFALAGKVCGATIVQRLLRRRSHAVFQFAAAGTQPLRNRGTRGRKLAELFFQCEDSRQVCVGQVVLATRPSMFDQATQRFLRADGDIAVTRERSSAARSTSRPANPACPIRCRTPRPLAPPAHITARIPQCVRSPCRVACREFAASPRYGRWSPPWKLRSQSPAVSRTAASRASCRICQRLVELHDSIGRHCLGQKPLNKGWIIQLTQ